MEQKLLLKVLETKWDSSGGGRGWIIRVLAPGGGEQMAHGGFPFTGSLEPWSQQIKLGELSRQICGFGDIISPVFL